MPDQVGTSCEVGKRQDRSQKWDGPRIAGSCGAAARVDIRTWRAMASVRRLAWFFVVVRREHGDERWTYQRWRDAPLSE